MLDLKFRKSAGEKGMAIDLSIFFIFLLNDVYSALPIGPFLTVVNQ